MKTLLKPSPLLFISILMLFLGCGDDLRPNDGGDGSGAPEGGASDIIEHGDGTRSVIVYAVSETAWVYFNLETGPVASTASWDLTFRRFVIGLNGGTSGIGYGVAHWVEGRLADFDKAPDGEWATDQADGDDEGEAPDRVFDEWFDYDGDTHVLTAKERVYFVRSGDGQRYYALTIDDYYDDARTSGYPSITWKEVSPPDTAPALVEGEMPPPEPEPEPEPEPPVDAPDLVEIDASDREAWVYVHLGVDGVSQSNDDSTPWDVALKRTFFRTAGGASADALGGARIADSAVAYDDLEVAPTTGYVTDAVLPPSGAPGSMESMGNGAFAEWYDYDPSTHKVTPKPQFYLLRTADGGYAKLMILSYTSGVYQVRLARVSVQVNRVTLTAEHSDEWVYFSLRDGASVEVESATESTHWDLGISGVKIRTNGGTTGDGQGGAYRTESPTLGEVVSGDADQCVADESLPEPGPPSEETFSGNGQLATWYDYDGQTHEVSPGNGIFVICTADGGVARVQFTGYADHQLTFDYDYAGLGREMF